MLKQLITVAFLAFYFIGVPVIGHSANVKTETPPESQDKILLTEENIQQVLNKLTDTDKQVLKQIQDQISTWPREVFEEIRAYKTFVIEARKKAEALYSALSPEAKEAMKIEQDLKGKLSPNAVTVLGNVDLQKQP